MARRCAAAVALPALPACGAFQVCVNFGPPNFKPPGGEWIQDQAGISSRTYTEEGYTGMLGWNVNLMRQESNVGYRSDPRPRSLGSLKTVQSSFLVPAWGDRAVVPTWTLTLPNGRYRVRAIFQDLEKTLYTADCRAMGVPPEFVLVQPGVTRSLVWTGEVTDGQISFAGLYSAGERSCDGVSRITITGNITDTDLGEDGRCPSPANSKSAAREEQLVEAAAGPQQGQVMETHPSTLYTSKTVQFYLEPGHERKLMTCGRSVLYGRVMHSSDEEDGHQWFDQFRVKIDGREAISVGLLDPLMLLPSADRAEAETVKAADSSDGLGADVVDADLSDKQKRARRIQRIQEILNRARREAAADARNLTTLDIIVDGTPVTTVSSLTAFDKALTVVVKQDATRRVGLGFIEMVHLQTEGIAMQIQSSMATNFPSEIDRIKNLHMDMTFTSLNATTCTGVLPEVWGIKPMSRRTAQLLIPPMIDH